MHNRRKCFSVGKESEKEKQNARSDNWDQHSCHFNWQDWDWFALRNQCGQSSEKGIFWQSFLICFNGIVNCIILQKNSPSKEFHYMKCQAFNPFPSSVMAQSPLRKNNKTLWWNEAFFTWIQSQGILQSGILNIRNHSWKLARREKYFVLPSRYFILTSSLVKSFCVPFAKQRLLYRCQSGFEFSW